MKSKVTSTKHEIEIIAISIFIVLSLGFIIFSVQNYNLIGRAVGDLDEAANISRLMALEAINISEKILQDMKEMNFSGIFVEDALLEAKKTFQQIEYAEILRGNLEAPSLKKQEAKRALALVDWKKLSYADVLIHTDNVKKRQDQALRLSDLIAVRVQDINDTTIPVEEVFPTLAGLNASSVLELLEEARQAFNAGRYDETEELLDEAKREFETQKLELTSSAILKRSTKNFFQKYPLQILLVIILLIIGGFYSYKKVNKKLIKKKIAKLKAEDKTIIQLIKKSQIARFKENRISEMVYNIKMKRLKTRLNRIKQQVPVFEERLKKEGRGNLFDRVVGKIMNK